MQKLKFENNKITHRYNVFLFSPLLTVSYLLSFAPVSQVLGLQARATTA